MIESKIYKHTNNKDVALEVQHITHVSEEGISLVGAWWNIVHQPGLIRRDQRLFIKSSEIENWKEFIFGVSSRKDQVVT